ncbi:pyridoxal phosphate-dependent decarboxylase family protein [Pikeienuella sp. HZG-20]|uniref:pyridoxal phosphate-dependent decarboxylase family protein n=1 Tax=Paludibacillus litoralis TaxID=3133267 RepID=UPI0030EF3125
MAGADTDNARRRGSSSDCAPGDIPRVSAFPATGADWASLERGLKSFKALDYDWRGGRLPSYTYFYSDELLRVQMDAYRLYSVENGLGEGRAFPSLTRMLEDISAMLLDLFHAPAGAGMTFTSGGTESLFEAVRTARNRHRARRALNGKGERERLNVVAPESAHAGLNKAGEIMDIDIVRVPVGAEWRADVKRMLELVDDRTIMLFASAPCYPYGVFDPIRELGAAAAKRDLWLHVDACWGGFISPFAKELGYAIPPWDLGVEGVTSLSADIHKFGYGAKGASALVFCDQDLKKLERFEFSGWPRGTYATPSFMGSKPAGAIAAAWAVMRFLGREGYLETTKAAMDATCQLIDGINSIPGLRCLEPNREANLYAYASQDPDVDIIAVANELQNRGWLPGQLREPLAIQQGVNPVHLPAAPQYLEDVAAAVKIVRRSGERGVFNPRTY